MAQLFAVYEKKTKMKESLHSLMVKGNFGQFPDMRQFVDPEVFE